MTLQNNILDIEQSKCTGCGSCIAVCPKACIKFETDLDGYYVAQVDIERCVKCGICKKVCPKFADFQDAGKIPEKLYCGKNKDAEVQYKSSSGGIATSLAEAALEEGYTVYGAWLDIEHRLLKHIAIRNKEDLALIRGSKYLQSYTVDAMRQIADEDKVLYIGTPCQIYALRRMYPDKDMLLVDFRCAGTPGYNLVNKYIDYLETLNSSGIKSINFRSKRRSWHIWGVEAEFNDGSTHFKDKHHDLFGKAFSRYHEGVHDVCRSCSFVNQSYADIRVEDAWHLMNQVSKTDYKRGFSQIAVFTENGKKLLDKAISKLDIKEVENTFGDHTHRVRKNAGGLFYMMRDESKPLDQIVSEYEETLSLKQRITSNLAHLVSVNLYVYRFCRSIYKAIKGGK